MNAQEYDLHMAGNSAGSRWSDLSKETENVSLQSAL